MVLSGAFSSALVLHAGERPKACSEAEVWEICSLKLQRNNALDELAISNGARHRSEDLAEATSEFWRQYLDGLSAQRQAAAEYWRKYLDGLAALTENRVSRAQEAGKGHMR